MKIEEIFPVIGRHIPIEVRLFEFTLILTVFVLYFWTIWGIFFGYDWPVLSLYACGSVIYTLFYIAQKRGFSFQKLTAAYYVLAYFLLALGWLPSGGLRGAIANMFVLVFISGLLILEPKYFMLFILATLCMFIGFSVYEMYNPAAAAKYMDEARWMTDISVSNIVMLGVIGLTLLIFKREYLRDRFSIRRINAQLEKEKLRAESADIAKTTFLANISHEMRTPLNGIRGTSELLRQTPLNEEQFEMVKTLTYSSDILYGLISDVLDVTMIQEERLVLYDQKMDVPRIIQNAIRFFLPDFELKQDQIKLSQECDAKIPKVLIGDPSRLRQVLINLINNVIRNSGRVEIAVKAELVNETHEVVSIRFTISDRNNKEAKGMPQELFLEMTDLSPDYEAGLGLNLCKKIIEAMGGEAFFNSDKQKGSSFYFTLPFKKVDEIELELQATRFISIHDLKVLVVDDQRINQMVAKKMLQNIGVSHVDVSDNGAEAILHAKSNEYDFILMDIRMPGVDGIAATKQILNAERTIHPIIIAVTANVMKADKEECLEAGMKDFISKPFTTEILEAALKKFIR